MADKPTFAIIGAQKAATTALQEALSSHSELTVIPGEVTLFEDSAFTDETALQRLRDLAPSSPANTQLGFKRADALAIPIVAERLRRVLPDGRFIAVLRHPVDRAVSAYHHLIRFGHIAPQALDDVVEALLDGSLARVFPKASEILPYGHYAVHLKRYLDLFDRDQVLVLFQEDLLSDPENSLNTAQDFLGVRRERLRLRRRNRGTYSLAALRLYYARTPWLFKFEDQRRLPKSRSLSDLLIGGGLTLLARALSRNGARPTVSTGTRQRLAGYYSDHLEELSELLNRRLPDSWTPGD